MDEIAQRGDDGKFVKVLRVINRKDDKYYERVTDDETGEVTRECKQKLSEHWGRGSAKPKKPNE